MGNRVYAGQTVVSRQPRFVELLGATTGVVSAGMVPGIILMSAMTTRLGRYCAELVMSPL
jgi:hypothetical protein